MLSQSETIKQHLKDLEKLNVHYGRVIENPFEFNRLDMSDREKVKLNWTLNCEAIAAFQTEQLGEILARLNQTEAEFAEGARELGASLTEIESKAGIARATALGSDKLTKLLQKWKK